MDIVQGTMKGSLQSVMEPYMHTYNEYRIKGRLEEILEIGDNYF